MIYLYIRNQHIEDIIFTCFVFKNLFKQKSPLFLTAFLQQLEQLLRIFCFEQCQASHRVYNKTKIMYIIIKQIILMAKIQI